MVAVELFGTFAVLFAAFAGFGLALLGISEAGQRVERKRSEEARRAYVERYGVSGRR